MSIKIYSCNDSRGLRPMWTAEEMGVSYESEMMPFPPRFLHKEYMDVNILGTIPYLIDGEVEMTESVAMCQYLVDLYGPRFLLMSLIITII
jgi:glutathione S-transferase